MIERTPQRRGVGAETLHQCRAHEGVDLCNLAGCGHFAGADGPNRFIGDDALDGFGGCQTGEGGFALVIGEPGTGKSAALRIVAERSRTEPRAGSTEDLQQQLLVTMEEIDSRAESMVDMIAANTAASPTVSISAIGRA